MSNAQAGIAVKFSATGIVKIAKLQQGAFLHATGTVTGRIFVNKF